MPDFNNLDPKKDVTDPKGNKDPNFPRHVHKHVTVVEKDANGKDVVPDGALVVAWKGKQAIYNEFLSVNDADELAAALADGYEDQPVVPAAPVAEKATKKGK